MPESIPQLLQQVADAFESTVAELTGSGRTRSVYEARAAAAWLLRRCVPNLTLTAIGDVLGGRDHSTVIHALRQVEARLPRDPAYAATLQALVAQQQPRLIPAAPRVAGRAGQQRVGVGRQRQHEQAGAEHV
jgi:chromosomal replication initiator protein